MLLNLYWTTHFFRLLIVIVTAGVMSHWFANAYPSESTTSAAIHSSYMDNYGNPCDFESRRVQHNKRFGNHLSNLFTVNNVELSAGTDLLDSTNLSQVIAGTANSFINGISRYPAQNTSVVHPMNSEIMALQNNLPEVADGESYRVVLHFFRCGISTSMGSLCRGALCCILVRAAEIIVRFVTTFTIWKDANAFELSSSHIRYSRVPFDMLLGDDGISEERIPEMTFGQKEINGEAELDNFERTQCIDGKKPIRRTLERFIRKHHEILFVHVAAYSKSYCTAAKDVWALLDESGLSASKNDVFGFDSAESSNSVMHAIRTGVASTVAVFMFFPIQSIPFVHDTKFTVSLTCLSFLLSYIASGLVLEVFNSASMAIYISFAEHPASLRFNFPIVHHRFSRITLCSIASY